MNITFKGIENFKVLKHMQEKEGPLKLSDGNTIPAKEAVQTVKVKCKLTDVKDNDLTTYNNAVEKVLTQTGMDFREPGKEDECTITAKNIKRTVNGKNYYASKLYLNDFDIELFDDTLLPIYSYLAKLTKKLTNSDITGPNQKPYTQGINNVIQEKACKYFDVTM